MHRRSTSRPTSSRAAPRPRRCSSAIRSGTPRPRPVRSSSDLRGPNATLTGKEASGLAAVAFGAHLVRRRKTRAVVAGGADVLEWNYYRVHDWFESMAPGAEAVARPFDRDRDGFVMGEGAFMFVLEDERRPPCARGPSARGSFMAPHRRRRAERMNAVAQHRPALVRVMRHALVRSGVTADRIAVVYASANGTTALDRVESEAIRRGLRRAGRAGHVDQGAVGRERRGGHGVAGRRSSRAGRRGHVPPTVGLSRLAADCPVDAAVSGARPVPARSLSSTGLPAAAPWCRSWSSRSRRHRAESGRAGQSDKIG